MQQALWDDRPGVRTVDQLTAELKKLVEGAFPEVSVEGEVVSCRRASSGHVYFDLKGRNATLPSVLFRSAAYRMYRPPQNGDRVICTGGIEIYPPHGRYQLVVRFMRLAGEGELLAQLDALKRKLHAEGLFDHTRKRPLPKLPRRVGVVTSPSGAAIADIIKSVHARFPVPILLAGAPVQGDDAPPRLIRALQAVAHVRDVDVVVIGRGGGSLQDLWAFNDERLARAIAGCPKPVVSAVGHEIDNMLSDFVADARAATPTGVGDLVVPRLDELLDYLDGLQRRGGLGLRRTLEHARGRLTALSGRLTDPRRLMRERWQRLDDLDGRLRRALTVRRRDAANRLRALSGRLTVVHPLARLKREGTSLSAAQARLGRAMTTQLERYKARLATLTSRLQAMSPKGVLSRGYAIVRRQDDASVIRSHAQAAAGDAVEILLGVGTLDATVDHSRG